MTNCAEGRCLCGAISFRATLPSKWIAHCHCSRCQRAHGAGVVTWVGFQTKAVDVDDAHGALRWFDTDLGAQRGFCGRCGSPLFFRSPRWADELHIARAQFSTALDRQPQAHVFYDSHVSWLPTADDGLPRKGDVG